MHERAWNRIFFAAWGEIVWTTCVKSEILANDAKAKKPPQGVSAGWVNFFCYLRLVLQDEL